MTRIFFILLLAGCPILYSSAQDSIKRTVKQPAATGAPVAKNPAYRRPDTAGMPKDQSLSGQYKYLLTKVYHYQQPFIATLWRNASDTLNLNKRKLRDAQGKLTVQSKAIDSLKLTMTATMQTLADANAKRDTISLAGVPITKSTYNLIMWGLVIVFGLTAAIVIARSGSFSREAKYRVKLYNDLEEEYKNYKVKANDKEKKLARELQTERNKLDDLLGNS